MDINNTLAGLVDTLSKQILAEVSTRIDADLQKLIEDKVSAVDIESRVDRAAQAAASVAAAQYKPNLASIDKQLATSTAAIVTNITKTAESIVQSAINDHVARINFADISSSAFVKLLEQKVQNFSFPDNSIPAASIDFSNPISGSSIEGGTINKFASTGIDDKSTGIQVTVLDSHTVIENHLLANELTINSATTFNGTIELNGTINPTGTGFVEIVEASKKQVKAELNDAFFADFGRIVFEQIKTEGLDLNRITLNGTEIVVDRTLAGGIVDSNLQKLGVLRELQVSGEALLYNTLYVSNQRVGINTLEPSAAFSLWDQEVEINIGKRQQGVAFIGSGRDQAIMLGTNNKNNLLLNQDGSVTTQKLNIGNMSFISAGSPPNYDAPKATVVFNSNPSLGGPMGWISLGEARWANFGIIE